MLLKDTSLQLLFQILSETALQLLFQILSAAGLNKKTQRIKDQDDGCHSLAVCTRLIRPSPLFFAPMLAAGAAEDEEDAGRPRGDNKPPDGCLPPLYSGMYGIGGEPPVRRIRDCYLNRHTYMCARLAAGSAAQVTGAFRKKCGAYASNPKGVGVYGGQSRCL